MPLSVIEGTCSPLLDIEKGFGDITLNQEQQAATCSFIIQTCCNLAGLSTIEGHILQTRLALLKNEQTKTNHECNIVGHRYIDMIVFGR